MNNERYMLLLNGFRGRLPFQNDRTRPTLVHRARLPVFYCSLLAAPGTQGSAPSPHTFLAFGIILGHLAVVFTRIILV